VAFTAPRIMGLEYKLARLCRSNAPLDQILSEVKQGMEEIARKHEEIGPPFSYALLTKDGFRGI
jgi:hypothetical protein